jgi:uncharacterized protein (TIGR03067 family)
MFALLIAGSLTLTAPVPKKLNSYPPDPERMQGAWEIVVNETNGRPKVESQVTVWTFTGEKMHSTSGNTNWVIKLDPTQSPKHIDIGDYRGVYEFDGDKLTIVYASGERPTEVKSANRNHMSVLTRVKDQPKK